MRDRRSVVEDYGKECIYESEIAIHSSSTCGYVYFKRKSFVYVHRKAPEGLQSCWTPSCLLCAFYG